MNNRTLALALAASFATFAPMIAYAQKPPVAAPAQPTFTRIAAQDPTPAPLVASPAPVAVLFAPTVAAPQIAAATPRAGVYPAPAPAVAPSTEQPAARVAAAPTTRTAIEPRAATERGQFRFAIEGGFTRWEALGGNGSAELGQLGAFFGWTLTDGNARPDGRRPFGLDLGFAIRLDVDDSVVVTRQQIAVQVAFPRIFGTVGVGFASAQSIEGGDPLFGAAIDVTIGWRVAGAFYLGVTSGMDVWVEGPTITRTGLILGFAVD